MRITCKVKDCPVLPRFLPMFNKATYLGTGQRTALPHTSSHCLLLTTWHALVVLPVSTAWVTYPKAAEGQVIMVDLMGAIALIVHLLDDRRSAGGALCIQKQTLGCQIHVQQYLLHTHECRAQAAALSHCVRLHKEC
jgi:hypothetical protein